MEVDIFFWENNNLAEQGRGLVAPGKGERKKKRN